MMGFGTKPSRGTAIFLVFLFLFLLHVTYLPNGFVWLDHRDIQGASSLLPPTRLHEAFLDRFGETSFYRPVVTILHSLDAAIYGRWAPGYHLTNVLLHLTAAAAAGLAASAFITPTVAELATVMLMTGIHPLGWLPAGAIAYRPELLLLLFTSLTIYFHVKARRAGGRIFLVLASLSFLLGLLSKETALVVIPAVILLWEATRGEDGCCKPSAPRVPARAEATWGGTRRMVTMLFLTELTAITLYFLLRLRAVPELWRASFPPLSLSEAIGTRLQLLFELLFDFVNPLLPRLSDAARIVSVTHMGPAIMIVLVLTGILVISKLGLRHALSRVLLLFAIFVAPALSVIPVPRLGSPHYGYIGLLPFALSIILLLRWFRGQPSFFKKAGYTVIVAWLGVMTVTTTLGGFSLRTDQTLFAQQVQRDPHFREGHSYLGYYYLRHNETKRAEEALSKALRQDNNKVAYVERTSVLTNLAVIKAQIGQYEVAERLLNEAGKGASGKEQTLIRYNRAVIANKQNDYERVIKLLNVPDKTYFSPQAYLLLADAFHRRRQYDKARLILESSLPLWDQAQQEKIEGLILRLRQGSEWRSGQRLRSQDAR